MAERQGIRQYFLEHSSVKKCIVQNLIEAGILQPDEAQFYLETLDCSDSRDLLIAMLESHNLREDAVAKQPSFYPVDARDISLN